MIAFTNIQRIEIKFTIPVDFRFMPKLGLSDASGTFIIDFPERDHPDFSIFINGITILNKT